MIRFLPFIALSFILAACSDADDDKKSEKKKNHASPTVYEKGLEKFTGARTKIVWTQYQNPDKVDKQGTSRYHYLMAIDSADGSGERRVLEERANYAYPIITPDGKQIVFTRKVKVEKGSKRKFDVTTEIVNFDGSGLRTLGKGYAQEVWEDPDTGKYWIYAGDNFILGDGTAPVCKHIIRYPIDDPSKREVVWDKTQMGTDSFAISKDGKRFAGLFPWPAAGIGDIEKKDWEKLTSGCWVSMAPDNSYDSWVFDGPHKNFFIFDAAGEKTATIPVNTHPALKGKEVYHPRWGNHRQFFVLSGPHVKKKGKNRGKPIEIFLGKFSPELDRVESWFQVSKNGLPDIYPDVWVEGASSASSKKTTTPKEIVKKSTKWPSNPEGLIFKWENIDSKNEFTAPDGSNQVTKLEPEGYARFGPNYEMVLDGGTFLPILGSEKLVAASAKEGQFIFQGLITASSRNGVIAQSGTMKLFLQEGSSAGQPYSQLLLSFGNGTHRDLGKIDLEKPLHISLAHTNDKATAFINGRKIELETFVSSAVTDPHSAHQIGGSGFAGTLEHTAFYNRPLTADEVAADYALIKGKLDKRNPIERIELKGKLVAMSALPEIDRIKPYVRALVYYAYETDDPKLKKIAVGHWAILDSKLVPGLPREIGKTYDLVLEQKDAHPELSSQAEELDIEQIDPLLPLFYDVSTLKSRK